MMPRFNYRAYDSRGAATEGELVAATREAALQVIHARGEMAIEIVEGGPAPPVPWWRRDLLGSRPLPLPQLAAFARELATLVKAEIPIDEALRIVAMQPLIGSRARSVAGRLLAGVVEGRSLSEALAAADGAFPDYLVRLVETGERSGQLGSVLDETASFLERAGEARSRIGSALLYPAILLAAAGVTLAIVVGVLIPTMIPIYEEAGTPPPAIVAFLAEAGRLAGRWWAPALAVALSATVALALLARLPRVRTGLDLALLRLPVVGRLVVRRDTARLARTLATLTRNGVPLVPALETAAGALGSALFRADVRAAAAGLAEGRSLTALLAASGRLPELALRLIAAGEQSGQLDAMLVRVAEIHERSLEADLQRLTSLLTPVLTIVIGLVVGGLVVSVVGALAGINDLALR